MKMFHMTTVIISLTVFSLAFCVQPLSEQDTAASSHKSRQKRGWGGLLRGVLTGAAWGGYAINVGTTLYIALTNCKHFRPRPCHSFACHYYQPCPDVCQEPNKNREMSIRIRDETRERITFMEKRLLDVYKYAVDSESAMANNRRIIYEIEKINGTIDRMAVNIALLDPDMQKRISNASEAILAQLQDVKKSLREIIISAAVQGLFDKWTWSGTGTFVASLGLNLGIVIFASLRERYAVHTLYKNMHADFSRRFINQNPSRYNPNAQIKNKFAYVQGYDSYKLNSQIRDTVRAVRQANDVVSTRTGKIVSHYLVPAANALYAAYSFWDTYRQLDNCQTIANKMAETTNNITRQRETVEKLIATEITNITQHVIQKGWQPALDFLRNDSILTWLAEIRNISLQANNSTSAPDKITYFLQNIHKTDYAGTILGLQKQLISALDEIHAMLKCISDKEHAVVVAITKCRDGADEFDNLFTLVSSTLELNNNECIAKNIVPQTSQRQLQLVIEDIAQKKGWYSNCLLNNRNLLIRVCDEGDKGHTAAQIVKNVAKTSLTENMVKNFLTRCPLSAISPATKLQMCTLYCAYETPKQIANFIGLPESQVTAFTEGCYSSCTVRSSVQIQICSLHFCKGQNVSVIEGKVRSPLKVVSSVITNSCSKACVLSANEKTEVCNQLRCKGFTAEHIASGLTLPLAAVKAVNNCDVILPNCGPVGASETFLILLYHCSPRYLYSAQQIFTAKLIYGVSLLRIQDVVNSVNCADVLVKYPFLN